MAEVVVIGAGVAGTAAAWAAATAGAKVTVIHDHGGASALYSGALDGDTKNADLTHFAAALGSWQLGAAPLRVATPHGALRSASGRDVMLLDLTPLAGKTVAVLDIGRDDWDATLVARGLSLSEWSQSTGTRFEVVQARELLGKGEAHIAAYDLAHRAEDPARVRRLAETLRATKVDVAGWLVGPWLGLSEETVGLLEKELGASIGESTSPPGGVAGARFELSRDRLLEEHDVTRIVAWASGVRSTKRGGYEVLVRDALRRMNGAAPAGAERTLTADAVVLAIGGVAGGGIELDEARPDHPGGACFHPSLDVDVSLELDGHLIDSASTLHGVDFTVLGMSALARVGLCSDDGVHARGKQSLFVAGDCVAGRPRSALVAAAAGIRAGRAAAQVSQS